MMMMIIIAASNFTIQPPTHTHTHDLLNSNVKCTITCARNQMSQLPTDSMDLPPVLHLSTPPLIQSHRTAFKLYRSFAISSFRTGTFTLGATWATLMEYTGSKYISPSRQNFSTLLLLLWLLFYLWCFSVPQKVDLFKLIQVSWMVVDQRRNLPRRIRSRMCHIGVLFNRYNASVDSSSRRRNSERQVKGWLPFHINFISIVLHSTVIPKHSPPTTDTVSSVSTPTREYPIGYCIVYILWNPSSSTSAQIQHPPEKQMTVGDCFLNAQNNWITRSWLNPGGF